MTAKYLNPKNDIAFKRIFGTERNKDILIHFLNDVIVSGSRPEIKEVTLLNPNQNPEIASKKQSIVDVLCEDESGIKYIVEMQVAKVAGFEKRAQYYAAKAYASQADRGVTYEHLQEVIFLAITEYEMFPSKEGYKSVHVILDQDTYERDLKDFSFTFIELPKFNKCINSLITFQEKWCYFFKHTHRGEDIIKILANSEAIIQKAYHELEAHNWTDQELLTYEAEEKSAKDAMAREEYVKREAREDGKKEGEEIGIKKGEEIGIKKGEEIGIKKGEEEMAKAMAKAMILDNEPIEKIMRYTRLAEEEIKKLIS